MRPPRVSRSGIAATLGLIVLAVAAPAFAGIGGERTQVLDLTDLANLRTGVTDIAPSSNMGFKAERDLRSFDETYARYLIAIPWFPGFFDIADASAAQPCNVTVGDGVIDPVDLLCDWWTSRRGGMTVSVLDPVTGTWQSRSVFVDPSTGDTVFAGDWVDPLEPGDPYLVHVLDDMGTPVVNPIVIVGSHDPTSCPQHVLDPSMGSGVVGINLPYHTMYRAADEILCGLERVDWTDADGDGTPDTCPNGIFDVVSGARVTVDTFDTWPSSPTFGRFLARSVERDGGTGELVFSGTSFDLYPSDGYLAHYGADHGHTEFCSPHF